MAGAPAQPPFLGDASVLDVSVAVSSGGRVTIRAAGELDALSAPVLRQAVDAACAAGSRRVVVDLRAVTFINAPGLRAIKHARRVADERGARLELATCPGHVARLLHMVALDGPPGEPNGDASRAGSPPAPAIPARRLVHRLVPAPRS